MGSEAWKLRTTDPALAERYRREGYWNDDTLGAFAARGLAGADRELRIWSATRPHRSTLAEEGERARRIAGGLRKQGIGPGDVVAYQLPNWVEAVDCFYAIAMLGAVLVPIVHFYGPREVAFILSRSRARAFVTADRFGRMDYLASLEQIRPGLPDLETVIVVGDERPGDTIAYETLGAGDALEGPVPVDPDAPAAVAYTSGTTAEPKGVIHSHRSLLAEVRQLAAMQSGEPGRPMLMGAPVAHAIGMLGGLLMPVQREQPIHLIDVWDPAAVLAAMREADLSSGSGAVYFLTSLLDCADFEPGDLERIGKVGLGGAPVPAAVADRVEDLGIAVVRAYGSTEHPSISGAGHEEPAEKRKYTDGHALPGIEMRLVDEAGRDVAPGEPGEIWSRGPDLFAGYTDAAHTEAAMTADGWFRTGDVGVLDEDGWLTITDRLKDVIIRGGANISAAEIEELLMRMPGVAECAVVAAPDERLGEHACAFFRMQPGQEAPAMDAVQAHLQAAGLAKLKWPEELRRVDDFDRTPSGKIKKFVLRARLRGEA